jgi:tetratricopeptide (TPR) repeat protein
LKTFVITPRHRLLVLIVVLVLGAAVFLPGVSGPYVFDDYSNLLNNSYLRIGSLDVDALTQAAWSLDSGPLQRPVATLSFALNYYLAGGFGNSVSFKAVNIALHLANALLVFWLLHLIFAQAARLADSSDYLKSLRQDDGIWLAGVGALLWMVHPIQVTSVLYVVQRMVELSALFTLLALICYLKGRERICARQRGGYPIIILGNAGFGTLAVFSKENALLLPVFIALLEYVLYSDEVPWRNWRRLARHTRITLAIAVVTALTLAIVLAAQYAMEGYFNRPFSLVERVLTEPRVLFFYISLILVPRIDAFGLHHEDIALSTSLLAPWATLPAIAGVVTLIGHAFLVRRRQPLLSLGVLWFFAGHLLESTVFPLEIAHEHRNYLASLGVLLAFAHGVGLVVTKLGNSKAWLILPVLALAFGGVTYLRATHWANAKSLFAFEALHRPGSAVAQSEAAVVLAQYGHYTEAAEALGRASELEPGEPSHLIWLQMVRIKQGAGPSPDAQRRVIEMLRTGRVSVTTITTMGDVSRCVQTSCPGLAAPLEQWALALLQRDLALSDPSFCYYVLGQSQAAQGKIAEAIGSFRQSHELDSRYLHPLFAAASIYVRLGRIEDAEAVLATLRAANTASRHPRTREIEAVARDIAALRERLAPR